MTSVPTTTFGRVKESLTHAPYVAPLGELASEDLFRMAGQVKALKDHPGWVFLSGLVEDQKREAQDLLAMKQASMGEAEIRGRLGFLRGMNEWTRAADAVLLIADRTEARFEELEETHGN